MTGFLLVLWTAAAYAIVGFAFLWLLSRALGPISVRARWLLLALPLLFTGRALLGGGVYAPADLAFRAEPLASARESLDVELHPNPILSDVHQIVIPWRRAVRDSILRGEWPLWNPTSACGEPLLASAQPAATSPIVLAGLLVPFEESFVLTASLLYLVAGGCAFVLMVRLGCVELAALLGALGWMYCNFVVFWSGWPHATTVVWLPVVVLSVRELVRRADSRTATLVAVFFALVLHGGHPETVVAP